jgi:hypothetical protein
MSIVTCARAAVEKLAAKTARQHTSFLIDRLLFENGMATEPDRVKRRFINLIASLEIILQTTNMQKAT